MRQRRTARVFVFDPGGRVLLIHFVVPRPSGEFSFWLTPGGEIEAGETEVEAARRELREELGLQLEVQGPVYSEANRFEHQGEMRDNVDYFFVTRCAADTPVLRGVTPEEIAVMTEIRWWSVDEVKATREGIFPVDLASRIKDAERFGEGRYHDPPERL